MTDNVVIQPNGWRVGLFLVYIYMYTGIYVYIYVCVLYVFVVLVLSQSPMTGMVRTIGLRNFACVAEHKSLMMKSLVLSRGLGFRGADSVLA